MPGIYGMAGLTISVTAIFCITFLHTLTRSDRRYDWLILAGLPLPFIVNRWVKIPVITGLAAWMNLPLKLGPDMPFWFLVLILLNAPLFEEAIKLVPLALPGSRTFLSDAKSSLWAGLALGMGFGLGEAAYLAYGIAQSPAYRGLPWYSFTGFASERLIVTFAHGFLTAIGAYGLRRGGPKALFGYLSAVGLHALINLGPILLALRLLSAAVSSLTTYTVIAASFFLFQKYASTARKMSSSPPEEIVYFERG